MPYRTPEPKDLEYEEPWDEVESSIDKEIYPFCKTLHFLGYPVEISCAGHPGREFDESTSWSRDYGYIQFANDLTKEEKNEVIGLARRYGLRGLKWKGNDVLKFKPVGGPS